MSCQTLLGKLIISDLPNAKEAFRYFIERIIKKYIVILIISLVQRIKGTKQG